MGPVTVSAWTFLISTVVLLPFLLRERRKRDAGSAARRLWTRQNLVGFAMIEVVGLVPASALLAWGTAISTASNASLIYLTVPIITAVLAWLILAEKMIAFRWFSLLISLVGVLVLSDFDWRDMSVASAKFL